MPPFCWNTQILNQQLSLIIPKYIPTYEVTTCVQIRKKEYSILSKDSLPPPKEKILFVHLAF